MHAATAGQLGSMCCKQQGRRPAQAAPFGTGPFSINCNLGRTPGPEGRARTAGPAQCARQAITRYYQAKAAARRVLCVSVSQGPGLP